MKKTRLFSIFILIIFSITGTELYSAQNPELKLSKSRYVDPKGYFKIVQPDGWRIQEFPQDARGKVAFFAPEPGVDLRVLVNAVDFTSFDQLFQWCRETESIFRQRLKASDFVVEKITFGGLPAVKRTFQAQGSKYYYIDFLIGKADHNLAYSASPAKYDKYLPVIQQSMETYEPVQHDISEKEASRHFVAKKLRLAQLMLESGNPDLAMEFVNEGLKESPKDAGLLKLKKQIEDRRKK